MGLVGRLVDRYRKRQEELAHKAQRLREARAVERARQDEEKAFVKKIMAYAADGKITAEELADLENMPASLGLSASELGKIRISAYKEAFDAIKRDGKVTSEEEAELANIQKYFKISDDSIEPTKKELARFRLLREIAEGNIPEADISGMVLQRGERAYWSEPGTILEERVVRRRYEGGSRGVSIRIARGVSYRVGAHKGHIVADTAVVPVSHGDFIITNKRAVFRGDKKSFSLKLGKILGVEFYTDGVNLSEESGKHRVVQFNTKKDIDMVGCILAHAVNNRA